MKINIEDLVQHTTRATAITGKKQIQSLWSGYGSLDRYYLQGTLAPSVVVKHVQIGMGGEGNHPRGWNTNLSHQRKLKSYQVETAWYQQWSKNCNIYSRVPHCLHIELLHNEVVMIMEDLDASGFALRKTSVSLPDMHLCLRWLANFHAAFINHQPKNLWETGTYWHLDTRPDELEQLDDKALKQAAFKIDKVLNGACYKTFVHGDAKLANFCFANNGTDVAAVDFQYVGGGCGIKDIAYFIGSCLYEDDCEKYETQLLDYYFTELHKAVQLTGNNINFKGLETEWRGLYPVAWTDFHRFIKGWSPGHWKINDYSERLAHNVIKQLNN